MAEALKLGVRDLLAEFLAHADVVLRFLQAAGALQIALQKRGAQAGDVIEWMYTCDLGSDVGGSGVSQGYDE